MPAVVTDTPTLPPPLDPPRKRWTRSECESLEAAGLLNTQRLERIEGELIDKMSKKRPHANAQSELHIWLGQIFGVRRIQSEVSMDLRPEDNPTNEPVPDLVVLARPLHEYRSANPGPADLLLVVEVADSTLRFDRSVKARLYARAGIVEYWVYDVNGQRLIVHREPRDGEYRSIQAYGKDESVAPLAAPDSPCRIADLLPPSG